MFIKFMKAAGSGLDTFLDMKNEDGLTKKLTVFGILILTIGLATLSITGAFAKSSGDGGAWVGRLAYALVVLGLELLAAVLFVRAMATKDRPRQIICFAIMLPLMWANVQNAKDGLHYIMPSTFGASSVVLNAKADLAREEAAKLTTTADTVAASTPEELERIRKQIADLRVEQKKMAAQSPEGVKEAQALLLAQGKYYGSVDGIRENLTEAAMRGRGEEIQGELAELKERETSLASGAPVPVQAASTDRRVDEIELRDQAAKAADAELRADVIFWISEFARQFLLYAAATTLTATATVAGLRRMEELAEAEHQLALAAMRAGMSHAPVAAAPVAPPPEPAPEPITEPVETVSAPAAPIEPELPPVDQRARKGGKNASFLKEAKKAAKNRVLILADRSDAQVMKVAAE